MASQTGPTLRLGLVRRIVIIGAGFGARHNSAARELCCRLQNRGLDAVWYDILDGLPRPIRFILRAGYTPFINYLPDVFDCIITSANEDPRLISIFESLVKLARKSVLQWTGGADAAVATHALATQTLGSLKQQGHLSIPTVSYLCGPSIHRLLFHDAIDANLAPTAWTKMECKRLNHSADVVGPLIREEFRLAVPDDRCKQLRRDLGIPDDSRVVLIFSGLYGLGAIYQTVQDTLAELTSAMIIVLCGHNRRLRRRLSNNPRVISLGWREDVPDLLAISDIVVQNAGGMAVWEADATKTHVVTYLPLPGHGKANARALELAGISLWPRKRDAFGAVLQELLRGWQNCRDRAQGDAADRIVQLCDGCNAASVTSNPPDS